MTGQTVAWAILLFGFVLPLLHVTLSPRSGHWRPPQGARCPLGPRVGWLVIVLLLGPVGWLLYMRGRARHAAGGGG
jgi:hypothetical protein